MIALQAPGRAVAAACNRTPLYCIVLPTGVQGLSTSTENSVVLNMHVCCVEQELAAKKEGCNTSKRLPTILY